MWPQLLPPDATAGGSSRSIDAVAISPHEGARGDIAVCGPAIYWLFVLTRHVRVPVHERTVGVIAPCPDMQFKQPR